MSATILRTAADSITARAAEMRAAFPDSSEPAFLEAVADLLSNEASLIESTETHPDLHMPLNGARVDLLLATARAWLEVDA